jgi:hypothetical protein
MRSRRPDVVPGLAVDRALVLGLCGVGGRLSVPPRDLADALARTEQEYDARTARRLERFLAVPEGATVWTRDEDGMFRRGILTGPWHYDDGAAAREADLVHVRACTWDGPRPEHEVPAAVAATFRRGGRNFQRIRALDRA